jgi:hypothetical protein
MKLTKTTTLLLGILTLIACAGLPACKKSNSSSSSMTATVNSTSFQSTSTTGVFHTGAGGQFDLPGVMVKSGDTSIIALLFRLDFQLNVPFSTDTTLDQVIYNTFNTNNGLAAYEAFSPNVSGMGHAIVAVTSWDSAGHRIAGTFSGTLVSLSTHDSVSVTNGRFNMTYTETY